MENRDIFDFELPKEDIEEIRKMDTNKRLYWSPTRWG